MEEKILVSLNDADIYPRDLKLFTPGLWLNSSCMNYCLRLFENEFQNNEILLWDPSVVSFLLLQCDEEDEYESLFKGNELSTRKWILIPHNDNQSFGGTSSHWSTLLCDLTTNQLYHFDSHSQENLPATRSLILKLSTLFKRSFHHAIPVRNCSQQTNGYDCGIYSLLFIRLIVQFICGHVSNGNDCQSNPFETELFHECGYQSIQPRDATIFRQEMIDQILSKARYSLEDWR